MWNRLITVVLYYSDVNISVLEIIKVYQTYILRSGNHISEIRTKIGYDHLVMILREHACLTRDYGVVVSEQRNETTYKNISPM